MEATRVAVALGYNAVIIVEGLLDSDEDLHVVINTVGSGLGIEDFGLETTYCP